MNKWLILAILSVIASSIYSFTLLGFNMFNPFAFWSQPVENLIISYILATPGIIVMCVWCGKLIIKGDI